MPVCLDNQFYKYGFGTKRLASFHEQFALHERANITGEKWQTRQFDSDAKNNVLQTASMFIIIPILLDQTSPYLGFYKTSIIPIKH